MKHRLLFVAVAISILGLAACEGKKDSDEISSDLVKNPLSAVETLAEEQEMPAIQYKDTAYDFGAIVQGQRVSHSFTFKNVGKKDLIINYASGSCGCTTPHVPKQPIKPGEESAIEVVFDSANKTGKQTKTITVLANTIPNTSILTITAEIK